MPDPVIVTIMLVTLAATLGIGFFSYLRARNITEYFAYGRRLKWVFLGLAMFASILSAFSFIGGPGLVYAFGSASLWIPFSATIGIPLAFILVGRKLQRLAGEDDEVVTLADAAYKRYGSQAARAAVALGILFGIFAYLGAQLRGAAYVLEVVFEIDFLTAFLIGALIITIYPLVGGIVAGINTDVLQGTIMAVAAVAVFGFAVASGGGMDAITATVASDNPVMVGPWGTLPAILVLSWFFIFTIGVVGMPHSTSKFLMLKDADQLKKGVLLATGTYVIGTLLWLTVGFAVRALVIRGDMTALTAPDQASPTFLAEQVPSWLAGLVFAGLASAILSTASTFLNVGAATLTRDLPMAFGRPLRNPMPWARFWTGALAVAAGVVAWFSNEFVALLGAVGFGLHAAALVPAFAIGLHWRRSTGAGVVASVATTLVGFGYFFLADQMGLARSLGWWLPSSGFYWVAMVMMLSMLVFIIVSYLTTPSPDALFVEDDQRDMEPALPTPGGRPVPQPVTGGED